MFVTPTTCFHSSTTLGLMKSYWSPVSKSFFSSDKTTFWRYVLTFGNESFYSHRASSQTKSKNTTLSWFVTVARRHDDGAEHIRWGGAAGSEEHGPDRRPPAEPGGSPEEQPVRGRAAQPQPQPHRPLRRSHPAGRSESEASGQRLTVSPGLRWSPLRQNLRKNNRIWKTHRITSRYRNISLLKVF